MKELPGWITGLLETTDEKIWHSFAFRGTMRPLIEYGMVQPTTTDQWQGISMHRLVQWQIMHRQSGNLDAWNTWYFIFISCISDLFESGESKFRRHMIPHLSKLDLKLVRNGPEAKQKPTNEADSNQKFTMQHLQMVVETVFAVRLWSTWAFIYLYEGYYKEAEAIFETCIEMKVVVPTLVGEVAFSMNNLAMVYEKQNRRVKAMDILIQVVKVNEATLGSNDPDTLFSTINLGVMYFNQGQLTEAERLFEKVINSSSGVPSLHDSEILGMNNLAGMYASKGRWFEADQLLSKVVEKQTRVLGHGHPKTIGSKLALAKLHGQEGRETADKELVDVGRISTEFLGPEHPLTLRSVRETSSLWRERGQLHKSELLDKCVLRARSVVLGPNHPDTVQSKVDLGTTYAKQGRCDRSEVLFDEARRSKPSLIEEDSCPLSVIS